MALRAELKARGLEAAVQVTYSGLTLVLKGKATPAQRLELWKALFLEVVGPVMYEDEIEEIIVKPAPQPEALEPPDAGSAPDAAVSPQTPRKAPGKAAKRGP